MVVGKLKRWIIVRANREEEERRAKRFGQSRILARPLSSGHEKPHHMVLVVIPVSDANGARLDAKRAETLAFVEQPGRLVRMRDSQHELFEPLRFLRCCDQIPDKRTRD